jgi:hypothetical protein
MNHILFLFFIIFIIKIIKNNKKYINKFEIYKKYNKQTYNELEQNEKYINKLLKLMSNSAPIKTKHLYENIIELCKKNKNSFHSIIYSISPNDIDINNKFNSDLKMYNEKINIKILKAKNIYESRIKKNNLFDDMVCDNKQPIPIDKSLNTSFSFF